MSFDTLFDYTVLISKMNNLIIVETQNKNNAGNIVATCNDVNASYGNTYTAIPQYIAMYTNVVNSLDDSIVLYNTISQKMQDMTLLDVNSKNILYNLYNFTTLSKNEYMWRILELNENEDFLIKANVIVNDNVVASESKTFLTELCFNSFPYCWSHIMKQANL